MTRISSQDKLIEDAIAEGYNVERRVGCLAIVRQSGRARKGVVIYEDGTAFLCGLELEACKAMRSYREVRSALGLTLS
jgi:hypothetical protein